MYGPETLASSNVLPAVARVLSTIAICLIAFALLLGALATVRWEAIHRHLGGDWRVIGLGKL